MYPGCSAPAGLSRARDALERGRRRTTRCRRAMLAALSEPIDCASIVKPVDWPPIRSPQAVHSAVAELLRKTDAVEIGTRNGDGMRCFARITRSAVAIELESRYCTELRLHSGNMSAAGLGGFGVHCQDYRRGTPDADFYTWWEHVESTVWVVPQLTVPASWARLSRLRCALGTSR